MSETISTKKLGELLHHWHEGQDDPIYAVGSLLVAGKPVDEKQIKKARERIRKLLKSAESGNFGWGQKEVEELQRISNDLAGLLRVYPYGEMPTLDDFRKHLSHDLDAHGRRYISSGKPVLSFDFKGDLAKQAMEGVKQADTNRVASGRGRIDVEIIQEGPVSHVHVQNIESLFYFFQGLIDTGPKGAKMAEALMEDIGYSWVGSQNPKMSAGRSRYLIEFKLHQGAPGWQKWSWQSNKKTAEQALNNMRKAAKMEWDPQSSLIGGRNEALYEIWNGRAEVRLLGPTREEIFYLNQVPMGTFKGNPVSASFKTGDRVQLHPGTDRWMMGDRYGEVVKVTRTRAQVKLDKSGRKIWFNFGNLFPIE